MATLKDINYGIGKYLVASDATSLPDIATNRKNLDLLNFKVAVNNAYSLYNFKDGMIDGYQTEDGVDTSTSTNYIYDSTDKIYKVSGPPTGGTITNYSTYTVHSFLADGAQTYFPSGGPASSQNFIVNGGGSADVLIVGGGGAGGGAGANQPSYPRKGGGASSGGVVDGTTTFTAGTYTITTALGGLKDPNHVIGGGGGNSSISEPTWGTVTANYGFGGGGSGQNGGPPGGVPSSANGAGAGGGNHSGNPQGGGRWPGAPTITQPSYPTQGLTGRGGYDGGDGHVNANGGSGGGAGGAGIPNSYTGGAGYASSIRDGTSYTYAQGGGGGTGSGVGPDATLFGQGGGGAGMGTPGNVQYGGNGFAGLVVIRYTTGALGAANMTLKSNAQTAQADPAEGRLILYEEDVDSITLDTDIKGYVSRDGGTTYTQTPLVQDEAVIGRSSGIDQYTKLMLHCDGANAGTTFTDSSSQYTGQTAHVVTANGDAQTSTTQKKFGTAAYKATYAGAGYLTIPHSTDFSYGTGDFTIEMWLYATEWNGYPNIYNNTSSNCSVYYNTNSGQMVMTTGSVDYGFTWNAGGGSPMDGKITNEWFHLAFTRASNSLRFFINGTQIGSTVTAASNINATSTLFIGSNPNPGDYWRGYMDEIRLSKGIARWTSTFTPPNVMYGNPHRMLSGSVNIAGQPAGTDMKYKVETLNDKNLILHGASLLWA